MTPAPTHSCKPPPSHNPAKAEASGSGAAPDVAAAAAARHRDALQALSNGLAVPYAATLRTVVCDGARAPARAAAPQRQRPPGYCRNAAGGFYTS